MTQSVPVQTLLTHFAAQQGCESYRGDSEKIRLLETYLWLRQLVPSLPFEEFLGRFAPLADYDETNRKHPADALKHHCPRSKKAAEEAGTAQWTAAECVDFIALYVDMVREAEATNTPVPMTFDAFLATLKDEYKAGAFAAPAEPAAPKKASRKKAAGPPVVRPDGPNQRVIYTLQGSGRQVRGVTTNIQVEGDRTYVTFKADDGELIEGVNVQHCERVSDAEHPRPTPPTMDDGTIKPELARVKLKVPSAQQSLIEKALPMTQPMGNAEVGSIIYPFSAAFPNGVMAAIDVVNGQHGPYVDARLIAVDNEQVLVELPPRKQIAGEYAFVTEQGVFIVEVAL